MSIVTNGLVGQWLFNEGIGSTVNDSSGNNNTGFIGGTPIWEAKGLRFNGVNDFIYIPSSVSLDLGIQYTMEVWLKSTENRNRVIIEKNNQYFITTNDTNICSGRYLAGAVSSALNLQTDRLCANTDLSNDIWHHIVISYSNIRADFYADTVAMDSVIPTVLPISDSQAFSIAGESNGNLAFNGIIGEVRFYNTALTQSDIINNYNSSKNRYIGVCPPLSATLVVD